MGIEIPKATPEESAEYARAGALKIVEGEVQEKRPERGVEVFFKTPASGDPRIITAGFEEEKRSKEEWQKRIEAEQEKIAQNKVDKETLALLKEIKDKRAEGVVLANERIGEVKKDPEKQAEFDAIVAAEQVAKEHLPKITVAGIERSWAGYIESLEAEKEQTELGSALAEARRARGRVKEAEEILDRITKHH